MKSATRHLIRFAIAVAIALGATTSFAQVPDHAPGSICATAGFWCWADTSGTVGTPCVCPSAQGLVGGTYI